MNWKKILLGDWYYFNNKDDENKKIKISIYIGALPVLIVGFIIWGIVKLF
ncbi:hypothetical protein JDW15_04200 [Aerococcaceae bacterium zg-ZJ1578]|nr:hypothetical protein [Aerococcaceae bacterium zg-1578]MBR7928248.1 hypothetical protein [Aerococcaceae bacterium zg-ZUI334]